MLETKRYLVDRLTQADAPRLGEILGDSRVMEHLRTPFSGNGWTGFYRKRPFVPFPWYTPCGKSRAG